MKLRVRSLDMALRQAFETHKGVTNQLRHVMVEVEADGMVGSGVAVPAAELGMTEQSVRAALDVSAEVLAQHRPGQLELLLRRLEVLIPGQPAARAAVDMALHDIVGKRAGLGLHELLGLAGLRLPESAISLGLCSVDEAESRARELASWPILKLKMSTPDAELVRAVRGAYPGRLWVDGNGAWQANTAVAVARELAPLGVELLEQPVPAHDLEGLRHVKEQSPIPVVADEACSGVEDVLRLASCAHAINIKLLKVGGLRRALEMIHIARGVGLKVMLGCKTESVIGTTAVSQLAGLADFLDVDGHLDIADDPFVGVQLERGRLTLPSTPGLGVRPRSQVAQ